MIIAMMTRRKFLVRSSTAALAAGVVPALIPASARGAAGTIAPSNRINVGCIGVGERGCAVINDFLNQPEARIMALCDVNAKNLDIAKGVVAKKYGNPELATYGDFRELLARKDVDVVMVASTDHWHVLHALAAVRAGKDVYVEKPLGLSLAELQTLRSEVQKHGRRFQFGTQQRSDKNFYRAAMLARNGRLGTLKNIYTWAPGSRAGGSIQQVPPPEGLDYDFWLGPTAKKPYTQDLCDRSIGKKTWWFTYDYAIGWVAGWGIHPVDIALWGAGDLFRGQIEVLGTGVIPDTGACNTATAWKMDYQFSSGVQMHFYGTPNALPDKAVVEEFKNLQQKYQPKPAGHGTVFEGTNGWVEVHRGGINASREELLTEDLKYCKTQLLASTGHAKNLLEAFKTRGKTVCPIEEAVEGDILCHLADQAIRAKRKLTWDTQKEQFLNDAEVNKRFASRPMREPWKLV
jgi:hypothetical protein